MSAETIAGLVEHAELNDSECLSRRLEVLRHPTSARLGPPDLCYLKKRKVGSGSFSSLFYDSTVGYYHWRLGLALDKGAESILNYLKGLLEEQEANDWSSWIVPTPQYHISYFHYCTYNAFRAIDIHLESQKVRSIDDEEHMYFDLYAVDKHGKRSPIQKDDVSIWKELRICGVLRYMARQLSLDTFDPRIEPLNLNADCLTSFASKEFLGGEGVVLPSNPPSAAPSRSSSRIRFSLDNSDVLSKSPLPDHLPISIGGSLSAEEAFLEYLVPFLHQGLTLGSYVRGSQSTIANNLMIQIPFKYLMRQGCYNVIIDFCCRMSVDYPDMLALEAKARRKIAQFSTGSKSSKNMSSSSIQNSSPAKVDSSGDEEAHANCVNALLQGCVDHPESLDLLLELSLTLLERGEISKAIDYSVLALQQYPDDFRASHTAALVHARANKPELAMDYLLTSPIKLPPPCKDFVGVPFHKYATEPTYDRPNADICRRIEETELVMMEENEAELSLSRANLNKIERIFYRIFHLIVKVSGKEVLVKIIRERGPKLRDAQEKARAEQKKRDQELEAAHIPPPRSKKKKLAKSSASKNATNPSSSDSKPEPEPSSSSVPPSEAQSNEASNLSTEEVPPISTAPPKIEPKEPADDFIIIDVDKPLPEPLSHHLDVTYDTLKHAYVSLLEDLKTVEKWVIGPNVSVAALTRLGLIHKRLGSLDHALEAFETALAVGWSFRGCRELCFLHVHAGKVRQALECADRSLKHLTHRWGTNYPDWQLRAAMWRLVARKGAKHVLHIMENLQSVNNWHFCLKGAIEDSVFHQVDNCNN